MKKFREVEDRRQQSLLPRSVEEFVAVDDLARYVDSLVEELDLRVIEEAYSFEGRRAFSPQVMVKILVYGKMRGIRSSRKLSEACTENLKFIYLSSGQQPDFRTIALFRKRFSEELASILQQTISIGLETGIIDLEHVAIDGTLVKSFAGDNSYKTPERIAKEIELLEQSIKKDIAKDESLDSDDDDETGGSLPKELQEPGKLKAKLQAALKRHKQWEDKPKRDQPKRVSITDPDCRYTRKGPAYNGQAAVDEGSRMVVAGYATNAVTDAAELVSMLEEIERNTKKNPEKITADAGYHARIGLKEAKARSIDAYIPQRQDSSRGYPIEDFIYQTDTDRYICPQAKTLKLISKDSKSTVYRASAKDCSACKKRSECMRFRNSVTPRSIRISAHIELIKEMNQKTLSKLGKEMARRRASTVETLFAHIKYNRKLRNFVFRGMNMINAAWKFELAVYNMERIIHFKRQGLLKAA